MNLPSDPIGPMGIPGCLRGASRLLWLLTWLRLKHGIKVPLRLVKIFAPWQGKYLLSCGKPTVAVLHTKSADNLQELLSHGDRLLGLWGYGANLYFFYLIFRDGESIVHRRLGFGGVYGNRREEAKEINENLRLIMQSNRSPVA